jgi:acylphosphatase
MSDLCHADINITGQVQGVFFRAFTSRVAKSLNVKGYVHNLPQGEVVVVAEGHRNELEDFVSKLHAGPPESLVENVDVKWSDYTGQFNTFEIK